MAMKIKGVQKRLFGNSGLGCIEFALWNKQFN